MLFEHTLRTEKEQMYDITSYVKEDLLKSGVKEGVCLIYCPHTTAGITINENADSDVIRDVLFALEKSFPNHAQFRHMEGNSKAHVKCSFMGSSKTVIVTDGELLLGIWQSVFFAEFDGPRTRKFYVKVIEC